MGDNGENEDDDEDDDGGGGEGGGGSEEWGRSAAMTINGDDRLRHGAPSTIARYRPPRPPPTSAALADDNNDNDDDNEGGAKTVRARRHNNQPSNSIAGEEEMLMEGDVAMEAETAFSMDLSVGVVLQKIYEELGDAGCAKEDGNDARSLDRYEVSVVAGGWERGWDVLRRGRHKNQIETTRVKGVGGQEA